MEPLWATFMCRRLWIDKSQDMYRVKEKTTLIFECPFHYSFPPLYYRE